MTPVMINGITTNTRIVCTTLTTTT